MEKLIKILTLAILAHPQKFTSLLAANVRQGNVEINSFNKKKKTYKISKRPVQFLENKLAVNQS